MLRAVSLQQREQRSSLDDKSAMRKSSGFTCFYPFRRTSWKHLGGFSWCRDYTAYAVINRASEGVARATLNTLICESCKTEGMSPMPDGRQSVAHRIIARF